MSTTDELLGHDQLVLTSTNWDIRFSMELSCTPSLVSCARGEERRRGMVV